MNPALLFPYGCCPVCGLPGVSRERRPDGNDRCEDGHTYPSRDARPFDPPIDVAHAEASDAEHCACVPALRAEIERLRAERAAVVAWLRAKCTHTRDAIDGDNAVSATYAVAATRIERGEHRREEEP